LPAVYFEATGATFTVASPWIVGLPGQWFIPGGRILDANANGRRLFTEEQGSTVKRYRTARLKVWNKYVGRPDLRWGVIPQWMPIEPPGAWEITSKMWFATGSQVIDIVLPIRDRRLRYLLLNLGSASIPAGGDPDMLFQWTETYE